MEILTELATTQALDAPGTPHRMTEMVDGTAPTKSSLSHFVRLAHAPAHAAPEQPLLWVCRCRPSIQRGIATNIDNRNNMDKMIGMSRLTIEIDPEQHRQIKTLATFAGMTLKEFILEKTLTP